MTAQTSTAQTSTAPAPARASSPGRPRPLAAVAAGTAAVLAGDAYHLFVLDDRPTQMATLGYRLHGGALIVGLLLLALSVPGLIGTATRLARTAVVALAVSTALVVGDVWAEVVVVPGTVRTVPQLTGEDAAGFHLGMLVVVFALFAVAWLLVGIAAARSGRCSTPAAVLLCVGAVLAFLPIGGSYVLLALGALAVALSARARD